MVGMWKLAEAGVVAVIMGACGTAGVIPKAYQGATPAAPLVTISSADAPDAEPIVVAPEVTDGWEFLYRSITQTEFVLCLEGTRQDGKIVIDGFRLARMEASSINTVRYQPCSTPRYIGTAHN